MHRIGIGGVRTSLLTGRSNEPTESYDKYYHKIRFLLDKEIIFFIWILLVLRDRFLG